MAGKRSALLLLLLTTPAISGKAEQSMPATVAVLTSHPESLERAREAFEIHYGKGRLTLILTDEQMDCAAIAGAGAVFVSGGFWSESMLACTTAVREMAGRGVSFGGSMAGLVTANWGVPADPLLSEASKYLHAGGIQNLVGFLVLLHNAAGGKPEIPVPPIDRRPETGIYHPDSPVLFDSLDDYEKWLAGRLPAGAPRAGILFFKTLLDHQDTAPLDALIRALEKRSLAPVAVFGWPLNRAEPYLTRNGVAAVDLLMLLDPVMPSSENAEFLEKYGLHAINLMTTSATEADWRAGESGLPAGRLPIQVGNAERSGITEPILIAASTAARGRKLTPLFAEIELAAARAARWAALKRKPNAEKRIALIYYNNPPGKATLGASYLDLIPSLRNVLVRLRQEGYHTGQETPEAEELRKMLLLTGRNVGEYAPGEVEEMVKRGQVALLPVSRYEKWFSGLPAEFQNEVNRVWGPPEKSKLMTIRAEGKTYFVIPGLRMGNLWLAPQPLRGEVAQADAQTHNRRTPPPHSYIAAYLWIRNQIHADAVVHFGRHGTLEWLPGKEAAQPVSDPGMALIGDLPHAYYYLVDGGGEFLQAKRRSNAVIISHLTPLLANAGIPEEFEVLRSSLENYETTRDASPAVAEEHARSAWAEARRLKLDEQLKLKESETMDSRMARLADYLHELEEQAIPLGLHRIGELAAEGRLHEAVVAFLQSGATTQTKAEISRHASEWASAIVRGEAPHSCLSRECQTLTSEAAAWVAGLRASPEAELANLVALLSGRYVRSGVSGDPLRLPSALPTGRNLHDQDPRGFPSKAAWAVGERMAKELIQDYMNKHGEPPKRVSFVLWYGESSRTQGLQEAQALALLGVRPVWNARQQVVDVERIPAQQLGRPRVDVILTMSGLYRDGMPEKLALLDKAVRLAQEAPEENVVQVHTREVEHELLSSGVEPARARMAARARVFGPQPGVFGVGMAGMMESSRDAGDSAAAQLYLRNMNYAYGAGLNGEAVGDALARQLKRNQVVVHARSSNLYGLVDNDETYQFAGGLNAATRHASGRAPEFLIANLRKAGMERYEEISHFLKRELASRLWNEKWISAMKAAGYAGAQQIAKEVEHLYGLRATAPEHVDPSVWQETLDVYINDRRRLGLDRWFEQANPHARQMLAARLIEIDRRGIYRFRHEDRRALLAAYVQSVKANGVSCYVNACANRSLIRYAAAAAKEVKAASDADLKAFTHSFLKAATAKLAPPAERARKFSQPSWSRNGLLAELSSKMRIFELPVGGIRLRPPRTAWEWGGLFFPVPFGILFAVVRRRLAPSSPATRLEL